MAAPSLFNFTLVVKVDPLSIDKLTTGTAIFIMVL
jgi:hypothetical protein